MTALHDFPTRPVLSLVPPAVDADLAAVLRTNAVLWQLLDRAHAQAAEEAEWQRRHDVLAALLPYGIDDRQPMDERLVEAGWARPVPTPVPPSPLLHQTAKSGGKPAAKFHALNAAGRTVCHDALITWPGMTVDDIGDVQRCQHSLCRAVWRAHLAPVGELLDDGAGGSRS